MTETSRESADAWVLVPREPTQEMLAAADAIDREYTDRVYGLRMQIVNQPGYEHYSVMLDAAPSPPASIGGGVRVKPLEWEGVMAATPFGTYTVSDDTDDLWHFTFHSYPYGDRDEHGWGREEYAKAAAQADYERRILAAIEPAPADHERVIADLRAENERLREAASTNVAIDMLTDGEGDSITFHSLNPDFNGLPNECVTINAYWTDWQDRSFRADSRAECLDQAIAAMRAAALKGSK